MPTLNAGLDFATAREPPRNLRLRPGLDLSLDAPLLAP